MGGWEAASADEVGGVGVSSVAVGVPVYCCNGVFNILPNSSGMYVGGWVNRDSRQKCGGSVGSHQSGQQSKVCMCVHCHTHTPPPPPVALPIKGVGQDPGYCLGPVS